MVLNRDRKATAGHPPAGLDRAVREEQDFIDRRYPADWDYYEDVVAKNPPSSRVIIPHKVTGEPVRIDLLVATPAEIVSRCAIPDHLRESSLESYRLFVKAQLPYWDQRLLPDHIPLLEKEHKP